MKEARDIILDSIRDDVQFLDGKLKRVSANTFVVEVPCDVERKGKITREVQKVQIDFKKL